MRPPTSEFTRTIADARNAREPYKQLRTAIGDVKLLGGLFVVIGLFSMAAAFVFAGRRDPMAARLMAIVNTLVLLGPGVWYFAAGVMMRRMNRQVLRQTKWVARTQLAIVPLSIVVGGMLAGPAGYSPEIFIIPAALTAFFVPALIALLFTFRRIDGLMNQIEPEGHGFEALPVQAMPLQRTVKE
jgi:hypothetical protein